MIKNERQYKITRAQAARFAEALRQAEIDEGGDEATHPLLLKARKDALKSQLDELVGDLREYEALKMGQFQFDRLNYVIELPDILIKARIARGLSQRELAERMGLKEQQIQRYEATDYSSASLSRIKDITAALNLEIANPDPVFQQVGAFQTLLDKVAGTGLSLEFIRKRLVPYWVAETVPLPQSKDESTLTNATAENIGRIFEWPVSKLSDSEELHLTPAMGAVRFKLAGNVLPQRVTAYTFYAHNLSRLVAQTCKDRATSPIPNHPSRLREAIEANYGSVSLRSIVSYMWDIGVPVLPLDDPGAFHGACFREAGRNVIVLKQKTSSESRWAFDLLHEIWHAGQEPDRPDRTVLEPDEEAADNNISDEETTANNFAAGFLLEGKGQRLAEICLSLAGNDLVRLKIAVRETAAAEGVEVESLANYMAFRLANEQGQNWWPTANSMQRNTDPWSVVRDVFFECADLTKLAEPDRQLIAQALTPWREVIYA